MKTFWQIKSQINVDNASNISINNSINTLETDLLIYGDIGKYFNDGNDAKELAIAINNIKTPVLNIHINSSGGDVFAGQAIYTTIKNFKGVKKVYIDGLAASAASLIAMAGDEIIMPKNALMMIHNTQTLFYGDSNSFKKRADDLDKINSTVVSVYQQKTGLDANKLQKMMNQETWLTADEALELGFATQVTDALQIAASIDNTNNKFYLNGIEINLPKQYQSKLQQHFKGNIDGNSSNNSTDSNICSSNTDISNSNHSFSSSINSNISSANSPNNNYFFNKEDNVSNDSTVHNLNTNPITAEYLQHNHADIYNAIFNAGAESNRNSNATNISNATQTERERIKAIDDLNIIGHEKLVYDAKYTNGITPEVLTMQLFKADQQYKTQYLADLAEDAQAVNNVVPVAAPLFKNTKLSNEYMDAFRKEINKEVIK